MVGPVGRDQWESARDGHDQNTARAELDPFVLWAALHGSELALCTVPKIDRESQRDLLRHAMKLPCLRW